MYIVIFDYQNTQVHYNEWTEDDEVLDNMNDYLSNMNLLASECHYMFTNEHMIMSNIDINPKLIVNYESQEVIAIPIYTSVD